MSMQRVLVAVAAILAMSSLAAASALQGVTSIGGKTQIWINSSAFDSKSEVSTIYDWQEDPNATGMLSGHAYYFPLDDPSAPSSTDREPWWAEFSINPSDVPGVTLSGTWYWWGRMAQFTDVDSSVDSQCLFVKNDPQDGSGTGWYDQARLTTYDNNNDRVGNDLRLQPNGVNNFLWFTSANLDTTLETKAKTFNLGTDGKIIFRISEREAGPTAIRFDVLLWTNDPNYVPTDADYPTTPALHPGDANADGKVSVGDLGILASNYGKQSGATWAMGDFNGDQKVTVGDLGILAANYGWGTIPEPLTLSLLGLGVLGVPGRGRKAAVQR